jgi:hypothetical protein
MSEKLSLGPHDSLEIRSSTPEALEVEACYRPGGERELEGGAEIGALLEEYADVFRLDL